MKLKITGDFRDVADSAWISTINEIRAKARTDDDARRVVQFLVDNHHTSPFECVTLTFSKPKDARELSGLIYYHDDNYSRVSKTSNDFTIDLLNFVKVTMIQKLFDYKPWELFAEARPELAAMCEKFAPLGGKILTLDVAPLLGEHGMTVELVSLHDVGDRELSRATWRVKCPLSIAVQILRHRTGSYNMVSGRYKTIRQEMVPPVQDCQEIFGKVGLDLNRFLGAVDGAILQYKQAMRMAREAKEQEIITNDEYKRLREFARFILPEGRMTELYITYYLNDFYNNYLQLRNSEHAQTEHIWIAQEMERTLDQASQSGDE